MKRIHVFLMTALILLLCAGCSADSSGDTSEISSANVASGGETGANELTIPEDMEPVYGSSIKDGEYDIAVESSSSMFRITSCRLIAENGQLTAVMTMGGKGYLYIFNGKGADASEEAQIPFEENQNSEHTFTMQIDALDKAVECAAYSKNKEKWYDRTLLFRADSLPLDAFAEDTLNTAQSLGLADGEYTVSVKLEGGSGKASVMSPAEMTVKNGEAAAKLIWSSKNYDYMIVDGKRYDMTDGQEKSTFIIPVSCFDRKISVKADTTAMSTPHEIEYTLYFDSASIMP